ncbi:hypothetical protein ABIB25_000013 [Nakamurella sp. UYEF19]|uniref:hypothetical protein n=1 Tax=Nakamurella sp. UYEF19 TaxID=1756392 RepID=UPI00339547E5
MQQVLILAEQAPEVHHSRPWRFQCTATSIDLLLAIPTDPWGLDDNHREAWVACGAALLNLRLAIRSCGVDPVVQLLPQLDRPSLLASVEIDGRRPTNPDGAELSLAIGLLETRTERFETDSIPEALMVELRYAARIEQAWIALLAPADFHLLGEFVGDTGEFELLDRSAHVAVIGTLQDDAASRIRAGQAMQRVLLTAARSDLSARFLAMTEGSSAGREQLRELIGGGLWPQVLLQIGRSAV